MSNGIVCTTQPSKRGEGLHMNVPMVQIQQLCVRETASADEGVLMFRRFDSPKDFAFQRFDGPIIFVF